MNELDKSIRNLLSPAAMRAESEARFWIDVAQESQSSLRSKVIALAEGLPSYPESLSSTGQLIASMAEYTTRRDVFNALMEWFPDRENPEIKNRDSKPPYRSFLLDSQEDVDFYLSNAIERPVNNWSLISTTFGYHFLNQNERILVSPRQGNLLLVEEEFKAFTSIVGGASDDLRAFVMDHARLRTTNEDLENLVDSFALIFLQADRENELIVATKRAMEDGIKEGDIVYKVRNGASLEAKVVLDEKGYFRLRVRTGFGNSYGADWSWQFKKLGGANSNFYNEAMGEIEKEEDLSLEFLAEQSRLLQQGFDPHSYFRSIGDGLGVQDPDITKLEHVVAMIDSSLRQIPDQIRAFFVWAYEFHFGRDSLLAALNALALGNDKLHAKYVAVARMLVTSLEGVKRDALENARSIVFVDPAAETKFDLTIEQRIEYTFLRKRAASLSPDDECLQLFLHDNKVHIHLNVGTLPYLAELRADGTHHERWSLERTREFVSTLQDEVIILLPKMLEEDQPDSIEDVPKGRSETYHPQSGSEAVAMDLDDVRHHDLAVLVKALGTSKGQAGTVNDLINQLAVLHRISSTQVSDLLSSFPAKNYEAVLDVADAVLSGITREIQKHPELSKLIYRVGGETAMNIVSDFAANPDLESSPDVWTHYLNAWAIEKGRTHAVQLPEEKSGDTGEAYAPTVTDQWSPLEMGEQQPLQSCSRADQIAAIATQYAKRATGKTKPGNLHFSFASAYVAKDAQALARFANGCNEVGLRLFCELVGIEFPTNEEAAIKAIQAWAGVVEQVAPVADTEQPKNRIIAVEGVSPEKWFDEFFQYEFNHGQGWAPSFMHLEGLSYRDLQPFIQQLEDHDLHIDATLLRTFGLRLPSLYNEVLEIKLGLDGSLFEDTKIELLSRLRHVEDKILTGEAAQMDDPLVWSLEKIVAPSAVAFSREDFNNPEVSVGVIREGGRCCVLIKEHNEVIEVDRATTDQVLVALCADRLPQNLLASRIGVSFAQLEALQELSEGGLTFKLGSSESILPGGALLINQVPEHYYLVYPDGECRHLDDRQKDKARCFADQLKWDDSACQVARIDTGKIFRAALESVTSRASKSATLQ